jgi:hypothetical protein
MENALVHRNVGTYLPDYIASHPREPLFQISKNLSLLGVILNSLLLQILFLQHIEKITSYPSTFASQLFVCWHGV